jgi:Chaperone of endosialidase
MTLRIVASLLVVLPLTAIAQPFQEDPAEVRLDNWPAPRRLPRPQTSTKLRPVTSVSTTPAPRPEFAFTGSAADNLLIFAPIKPCRLVDTRTGTVPVFPSGFGPPSLAAATPRNFALLQGPCGLPTTYPHPEAYSLNVTVIPIAGASPSGGFITVYPGIFGATGPEPGTLPLDASLVWQGSTAYLSNSVIVAGNGDGSIYVYSSQAADIVIDINGYYAAPTGQGSNTALGTGSLAQDTAGGDNTAFGASAFSGPSTGSSNTALGFQALGIGSPGDANTAVGDSALDTNGGSFNTAVGDDAMSNSPTGSNSTALGALALYTANGDRNIGIGFGAGSQLRTGSDNIMIGNAGTATDDHTIRIGAVPADQNVQTSTYIAGILGNNLTNASTVVINSSGQLGVQPAITSSRRYKEDIHDMGDASNGLLLLRPVTFHYKKPAPDGSKPLEYGLIAEEVDAVYPELVVRGTDGQIETLQYSKLPAMLLNELQKQYRHAEQQDRNAEQQARHAAQQDETIRKLEARLAALEAALGNPGTDKAVPTSAGTGR